MKSFILILAVLLFAVHHALALTAPSLTLPATATLAEIQNALDNAGQGEVVLSPGTYELGHPLLLHRDGANLRGSGLNTVLHLADNANCPVIVMGPPLDVTHHITAHLRLSNLLIDGNRLHQKKEFWRSAGDGSEVMNNGIQIWNSTDVVVEHVTARNCRSGGLVTAGVRRLVVTDFDSYGHQFDGLACYETEQSHFSDIRLHDNLAAGISLDLSFNHNFITNATLTGNDLGIFMRDSNDNSFRGLKICKSHHHGIFMAQTAAPTAKGWRLLADTECSGNHFENLFVSDCGGNAFKVNDASCTNNSIQGARFTDNLSGLSQPSTNPVTLFVTK